MNAYKNTTKKGATAKPVPESSDQEENDLSLAEEGDPSADSKGMRYIVGAMEKQMVFMESMQKQIEDIQAQLAELKKERE